jgi:hypothetical protein
MEEVLVVAVAEVVTSAILIRVTGDANKSKQTHCTFYYEDGGFGRRFLYRVHDPSCAAFSLFASITGTANVGGFPLRLDWLFILLRTSKGAYRPVEVV